MRSEPTRTLDQRADDARTLWARVTGEPLDHVGLTLHRTTDARWCVVVDAVRLSWSRAAFGASVDAAVDALLATFARDASEAA